VSMRPFLLDVFLPEKLFLAVWLATCTS
jgi:hypothetical protein